LMPSNRGEVEEGLAHLKALIYSEYGRFLAL